MKDDDIFDDDDLMGQPEDPTVKKKPTPQMNIPPTGISMSIEQEKMRDMQKKDILSDNEVYETELGINEKNVPVTNEKFDNKVKFEDIPLVPSVQEVINSEKTKNPEPEVPKKSSFVQDENHPIPTKAIPNDIPLKSNKIEDISDNAEEEDDVEEEKISLKDRFLPRKKELSVDDLDEDSDSKEYISRHDIIYTEKKALDMYSPPKVPEGYDEDDEEEETSWVKNLIAILVLVIIGFGICFGVYHFVSGGEKVPVIKYSLTEEDRTILTEEYFFISSTEEYLIKINELVEDERQVIDRYVSGIITSDEASERLETSLLAKKNLHELYIAIKPIEEEVIETKKLSDKIFNNTISYTESAINSLNYNDSKSRMVANFNTHIEENNSNIYMYNQYVMSIFKKRGITITYDGVNFAMDTKWLDNN